MKKKIVIYGMNENSSIIKIDATSKDDISKTKEKKLKKAINDVNLQIISDDIWQEIKNIYDQTEIKKEPAKRKFSSSLYRLAKYLME